MSTTHCELTAELAITFLTDAERHDDGTWLPIVHRGCGMTQKRTPSNIHRRMMRGESIPALRPKRAGEAAVQLLKGLSVCDADGTVAEAKDGLAAKGAER